MHRTLFCGSCRARLPGASAICHFAFPYLLGAAADYTGSIKSLVLALKFALVRDAAEELSRIILAYARPLPLPWPEFAIVPVPLSPRRLRERGFNQAELLAAGVASGLRLPVLASALVRVRHTPPQSLASSVAARAKNVAGAFLAQPEKVRGRKIALIDDVVTSGATLAAAAVALKNAGARRVVALVAARRA